MFTCKLCGLTVEAIPEDSILVGKLTRFVDGSFHLLRKKLEPRTGPRPRKRHPDQEAETPVLKPDLSEFRPVMGRGAHNVPEYVEPVVPPAEVPEVPVGETALARAFRLKKVA
jgi:hypothetical protein